MCEHVFSVNTLRMKGFCSPENHICQVQRCGVLVKDIRPCRVTMLAIWMTGSVDASGKIPFLPAHSISKLSILRGAILDQISSGA